MANLFIGRIRLQLISLVYWRAIDRLGRQKRRRLAGAFRRQGFLDPAANRFLDVPGLVL